MNEGFSICFNIWALDKTINGELGLLLIISSLCAEKGYCYASNKYFSDLFHEHETTISRKIKKLEEKKYINIEYIKRGAEVKERKIRLAKLLTDDYQYCYSTISNSAKENNISINNTNNNNNSESLLELLEKNFCRTFNAIEIEEIMSWEDNDLTRYAIKKAVLNNKCNVNYISKILYNYKKENIRSVSDAIQKEEEYQSKKTAKAPADQRRPKATKKEIVPEWFEQDAKTEESAAYEKQDAAMQVEENEEGKQLLSDILEMCQ